MLDKRKIRLMIRMASYEKREAQEDLRISSYYKKDYVSMKVWESAIWISIGYCILAALFIVCNMNALMENLTIIKLTAILGIAAAGYLFLLIVYCVCAAKFYKHRHNEAKQHTKKYYRDLSRLEKMNMKEKK